MKRRATTHFISNDKLTSYTFVKMVEMKSAVDFPRSLVIDKEGNYVVNDRSNKRLQVFTSNWELLRTIAVCCNDQLTVNSKNEYIITDDCSVVILNNNSNQKMTFGSKGTGDGEF